VDASPPTLRALPEAGQAWDDPSEDLLFMSLATVVALVIRSRSRMASEKITGSPDSDIVAAVRWRNPGGTKAGLAANVAVAEPSVTGRVIAAWPSFSLIAAYELLMRQIRRVAETRPSGRQQMQLIGAAGAPRAAAADPAAAMSARGSVRRSMPAPEPRREAWRWALDHRAEDGSLPSGRAIAGQYGRHERWGRLVKRSGLAGQLGT